MRAESSAITTRSGEASTLESCSLGTRSCVPGRRRRRSPTPGPSNRASSARFGHCRRLIGVATMPRAAPEGAGPIVAAQVWRRQKLARVCEPGRVEGAPQPLHDREIVLTEHERHRAGLVGADAVLTRQRAASVDAYSASARIASVKSREASAAWPRRNAISPRPKLAHARLAGKDSFSVSSCLNSRSASSFLFSASNARPSTMRASCKRGDADSICRASASAFPYSCAPYKRFASANDSATSGTRGATSFA